MVSQSDRMSAKTWETKNLTFQIVTEKDYPRIDEFLKTNFYPDEPIWRSTKLVEVEGNNGLVNKYVANLVKKHTVLPCLKDSTRELT